MIEDKEFHKENSLLKKDEDGLTKLESRIAYLFCFDPSCKGDRVQSMKTGQYSTLLNAQHPPEQLERVAKTIFSRKAVKESIKRHLEGREADLVYDRLDVQKKYKEIYNLCLEDPRSELQKDPSSDDFVAWKPDLKTAKSAVDSMARTLGMFIETSVQVVGEDAAELAKKAYRKNREKRISSKMSGQALALKKKNAKVIEVEVVD